MSETPILSYGRQSIDDDDIEAVAAALRADLLTTGPLVDRFERALAESVGAKYAIACNSGTAALYLASRAAGLGPGDTVVVPAITFVATASANVLAGADVVFADVDPDTGLMEAEHADEAIARAGSARRIKAIFPVHMGGRVGDTAALHRAASRIGAAVIEDACHALGTEYGNDVRTGDCRESDAACFSFHPVKTIAMGEGGAVTTNDDGLAAKARQLRNHGIERQSDAMSQRDLAFDVDGSLNPWYYEVAEISHNLRVSDINCALGLSQLGKLGRFVARRRALMAHYATALRSLAPTVRLIDAPQNVRPGWHLCSVLIDFAQAGRTRRDVMARLLAQGIGSQVHYIPVNLQPFYRARGAASLPGAWSYYCRTLTLPLSSSMTEADVDRVVAALRESLA